MAIQWFFQTIAGQPSGPVDSGELRRLAEAGIVRPDTLVRQGDSGRWVRAEQVRGLFQPSTPVHSSSPGASPPPPPPPPSPPPSPVSAETKVAASNEKLATASLVCGIVALAYPSFITGPIGSVAAIVTGILGLRSQKRGRAIAGMVLAGLALAIFGTLTCLEVSTRRDLNDLVRGEQQAEKDQPLLAAAQSAESGSSTPAPQAASQPTKTTPAAAPAAEPKSVPATGNVKILELADLAELVGPSVVQVNVRGPEKAATGSGFVLDKQGTIVTNFHVIEDVTAGRIVFSDRTSAPITGYLGVWAEKDIALVRVECPPEKLHPLRLATSAPRQGERVAAFGSPLGLQQSVSEGIVSAVRESEELRALGPIDVNARLIQTTTPISHGNSGGPLVDMKGMVVGINTLTFRPLGGENVNFAVAAVELPPLLLAKSKTPSPLPASDPAAGGVRRIMRRAWAHMKASEYDEAIADFTEAIRLDPTRAFAYFNRGSAYYEKFDYDSAIADYTQIIRLKPKFASAYYMRGSAYYEKFDYDKAIADYTQAIRLDPKNDMAYFRRGKAYHCKDDYDSAIADYTRAIRLNPKNARAYCCRGHAYYEKFDYDSAIADYTQIIRLKPKNAHAYHCRAEAYCGKDDYDSAIADYTQAIRLDPKDVYAYRDRASAYQEKGDYDSAIADYTQIIRLKPIFAFAYHSRGEAYRAKRDYDSAIADYSEAIRLKPKNALAYHFRGLAYQKKGQRAAAKRDFAKAKRLGYKP